MILNSFSLFEGNIKINSYSKYIIDKCKNEKNISFLCNNIYGYQDNMTVKGHVSYELYSYANNNIAIYTNNIISEDIIIHNEYAKFKYIFYDTVTNKHNIIHASCCNRIKQMKIRGTNYESLIIQLVMNMLEQDGYAMIVVTDSFLFSDSNQMVDTRRYLIENFNITNIIEINESFYNIKGQKNSFIFFNNIGSTKNINFSKLENGIESIENINIDTINVDLIKKNNYSLYYKLYDTSNSKSNMNEIKYTTCDTVFNFIYDYEQINDDSNNIFAFDKYYKDITSINITTKSNLRKDHHIYIEEKIDNINYIPNFCIYYLEYLLKSKHNLFLKGKLNQIDIDKLYKIQIPILSKQMQETIVSYYKQTNSIYNFNLKQIENYLSLKHSIFTILDLNEYHKLDTIVSIYTNTEIKEKYMNTTIPLIIQVIKNSSLAGSVILHRDTNMSEIVLSNNSYYLVQKNDIPIEYIYYYMSFIRKHILELSKLTAKPTINISQLSNILITKQSNDIMDNIIVYCKDFHNSIMKLELENENIKSKDILTLMSQIYNFNS